MMELGTKLNEQEDIARKCKVMEKNIKEFQDAITSLEKVIQFKDNSIDKEFILFRYY